MDLDLAVWLRSLGLEQYEPAFRDNAITEKLLPSLTAEDLKDLGRRRADEVGEHHRNLTALGSGVDLRAIAPVQM